MMALLADVTRTMPIMSLRLLLRPFQSEDITDAYLAGLNDPEVVRWTEARHQAWTRANAAAYVNSHAESNTSCLFGMFVQDSQRHIGNILLSDIHPIHRRAELALLISDRASWSQGYGTEGVIAVTQWAFESLGLHRISAGYFEENAGSAKLFAKAGYQVEGIFRDHGYVEGRWRHAVRVAKVRT